MNNNRQTEFLKNECNIILQNNKDSTMSESEFENYLKLPLKNFNNKFRGLKISDEDNEKLKEEIKIIMAEHTTKLTEIYLTQNL